MGEFASHRVIALLVAACVVVAAPAANAEQPADQPAETPPETPWSKGVKAEDRDAGQKLFVEGNALFGREKYSAALVKYRAAIKRYDHPSIRFNLAVILIRMDRPVEAYRHLLLAMRFGAGPFERPELFNTAKTYKRLLEGRLTRLEVKCSLRGAKVSLDGEHLLTCPGTAKRTMKPGMHQLVGTKRGYMTRTRDVMLLPGKNQSEAVTLISIDSATVTRRRWARWKPWAVTGAGALIAATGIPLVILADSNNDKYDELVRLECSPGCLEGEHPDTFYRDRSKLQQTLAVSSFIIGGAVLVSGVTMALLNRPRSVRRTDVAPPPRSTTVQITPTIAPGHAGVALTRRF